jgi:hypothetical protein
MTHFHPLIKSQMSKTLPIATFKKTHKKFDIKILKKLALKIPQKKKKQHNFSYTKESKFYHHLNLYHVLLHRHRHHHHHH